MHEALDLARTALFVPGVRPERFEKARQSGADLVILDLEDSVLDADKDTALSNVLEALKTNLMSEGCPLIVRVNSDRLSKEIPLLIEASKTNPSLIAILVPKVELTSNLPEIPKNLSLIGIVESGLGLKNVNELAGDPRVHKLAFGGMDFAAEMGSNSPVLHDHARVNILLASVTAGISRPWDSPSADIKNLDAVLAEAKHASDLGFGGKLVIHPAQVEPVHQGFEVSTEKIEWARTVLASTEGAAQVQGQMVDKPVILQAKGILKRAGLTS
jgi:citrate lyase subunit beta/citryl-CoA lyase